MLLVPAQIVLSFGILAWRNCSIFDHPFIRELLKRQCDWMINRFRSTSANIKKIGFSCFWILFCGCKTYFPSETLSKCKSKYEDIAVKEMSYAIIKMEEGKYGQVAMRCSSVPFAYYYLHTLIQKIGHFDQIGAKSQLIFLSHPCIHATLQFQPCFTSIPLSLLYLDEICKRGGGQKSPKAIYRSNTSLPKSLSKTCRCRETTHIWFTHAVFILWMFIHENIIRQLPGCQFQQFQDLYTWYCRYWAVELAIDGTGWVNRQKCDAQSPYRLCHIFLRQGYFKTMASSLGLRIQKITPLSLAQVIKAHLEAWVPLQNKQMLNVINRHSGWGVALWVFWVRNWGIGNNKKVKRDQSTSAPMRRNNNGDRLRGLLSWLSWKRKWRISL